MEQTLKRAAIVSRSTAAEGGKEKKERERESVCVCVSKWGKRDAKAQRRHYSPPAHGAACGSLYSVRSYLQTRLLVHNDEKMVVRKGNDRSARALPCGVGRVWGNLSPACMHALHLPGALKIDPPGSTRRWCFLWLESSAGNAKQGAVPLKQVRASSGRLRTGRAGTETMVGCLARLASWVRTALGLCEVLGVVLLACPAEVWRSEGLENWSQEAACRGTCASVRRHVW